MTSYRKDVTCVGFPTMAGKAWRSRYSNFNDQKRRLTAIQRLVECSAVLGQCGTVCNDGYESHSCCVDLYSYCVDLLIVENELVPSVGGDTDITCYETTRQHYVGRRCRVRPWDYRTVSATPAACVVAVVPGASRCAE